MSQAKCPSCGQLFDNRRDHPSLRHRLLFGPERLIVTAHLNAAALDTCPSCGHEFASREFSIFGEFVRARLRSMGALYAVVGLLVAGSVAILWMAGK
jgi:uncharacterized C2H2 Zn-finger protein